MLVVTLPHKSLFPGGVLVEEWPQLLAHLDENLAQISFALHNISHERFCLTFNKRKEITLALSVKATECS